MNPEHLLTIIEGAADEIKALDPAVLDIQGKSTMADYMFICTGTSDIHVRSIVERIERKLRDHRVHVNHIEGLPQAKWVLMDYGTVIVNVMQSDQREYYGLERFWEQMPVIDSILAAGREGA